MAKLIFPPLLFLFSLSLILLLTPSPMAQSTRCNSDSPAVQIVYVEKPRDEQPEAYHIRILASVLGSEEAAREALLYSYKNAASAFSARLTPYQVAQLAKQEGVLQVVPSRTLQLHSEPSHLH
ncbi:subtilisin-like protease SBT3.17 [Cucumis sativus]|nr:subtilisin-like protease SBT3.17 [Cucumis sativus]KAE8646172.1 hypothetical protein Csa_016032 [Cucumis sativus]